MTKPKVKLEELLHEKKKRAFEQSQQQSKSKVTGKQSYRNKNNKNSKLDTGFSISNLLFLLSLLFYFSNFIVIPFGSTTVKLPLSSLV